MQEKYKNPFQLPGETTTGDPFAMRFNGSYYFYKTSRWVENGVNRSSVKVFKSDDLIHWTEGTACNPEEEAQNAYAPEVHYVNGRFYMVASSAGNGHFIYEADDPMGPFVRKTDRIGQRIDGSFFLDDDGTEWFYRAEDAGIRCHRMKDPVTVDLKAHRIPETNMGLWTEGPLVLKHGGFYFLTYTGNHLMSRGYRVDYSVSPDSPVSGYVNMKNRVLLLETGDDFHALGHSSSVLSPDMDGAFIIYHNYEFLERPKVRRVNVDRLFFNKARMYVNACWWEQDLPLRPAYEFRGGEDVTREDGIAWFNAAVLPEFTAEWNLIPEDGASLYFGNGEIRIADGCVTVTEGDRQLAAVRIPKNTALDRNVTIRLAHRMDGFSVLYLNNGQELLSFQSEGRITRIGIEEGKLLPDRYFAVSPYAFGGADRCAVKAVPGRFDAVHAEERHSEKEVLENGLPVNVVKARAGEVFTYPVNVREDGRYGLAVSVRRTGDMPFEVAAGHLSFLLEADGQCYTMAADAITEDHDQACTVTLGEFTLKGGSGRIRITALTDMVVDSFRIFPVSAVENQTVIENSRLCVPVRAIGEKMNNIDRPTEYTLTPASFITKHCGFTVSEQPNFGFFGGGGKRDMKLIADAAVTKNGDGFASLLLRSTRDSWFGAQVKDSADAVEVRLDAAGVHVIRLNYEDTRELAFAALDFGDETLHMEVYMKGNLLSVSVRGKAGLKLLLPDAPPAGECGFRFDTEDFGFRDLKIEALP